MECCMKYTIGKHGCLVQLKKEFGNGKISLTQMKGKVRVTSIFDLSDKENVGLNLTKEINKAAFISSNMDAMEKYFSQAVPINKYKTRTGIINVTKNNGKEDMTFRCEPFPRRSEKQMIMTVDDEMQELRKDIEEILSSVQSNEEVVMLSPSTLHLALRDVPHWTSPLCIFLSNADSTSVPSDQVKDVHNADDANQNNALSDDDDQNHMLVEVVTSTSSTEKQLTVRRGDTRADNQLNELFSVLKSKNS